MKALSPKIAATCLWTGLATLLCLPWVEAQAIEPADWIDPSSDADFYRHGQFPEAEVSLGQALFFDAELSGNRNISCATCHHPVLGTSDGLPLSIGEGGHGLGPRRRIDPAQPVSGRVPRHSPSLYFVGAREFERLFHDGRVEPDHHDNWDSGFWTPARDQLPAGLDNVLAAQAMFPVASAVEMAGQKGENELATAVALGRLGGVDGLWNLLARRLRAIPGYVAMFRAAYPHIRHAQDIHFVDAANALAAFQTVAFRADGSEFDQYLETGNAEGLSDAAARGMALFYGNAGCMACHSGKYQTDQQFHAIGMPQIGPGKNDGWDTSYWMATGFMARLEDYGRARETLNSDDRYAFRTPSLRNVALTPPYGHTGAYATLEAVIRHHANPSAALEVFDTAQVPLPKLEHVVEMTAIESRLSHQPVRAARLADHQARDGWVMQNPTLRDKLAAASEIQSIALTDADIDDLVAFLHSLTDPAHIDARHLVPASVPSGLPLEQFPGPNLASRHGEAPDPRRSTP